MQWHAGLLAQMEDRTDGLNDQGWIGQGRQLGQPHPIGEGWQQVGCQLQREARLARSARTDQGQQARGGQALAGLFELAFASYEAGELNRQVVRKRVDRPEWRKLQRERRVRKLEDTPE
jgi:hypothetical protein